MFNSLPVYIKTHFENTRHFKKMLKNYLLEHSLYSMDEYYHLTASWIGYTLSIWINLLFTAELLVYVYFQD